MMPASFAIPYLLTSPLPASIGIAVVPDADAACRPAREACYATVRAVARNRSNRTLFIDDLYLTLSSARRAGVERPFDPPLAIAPFEERTLPGQFAFHVEAAPSLRIAFHAAGEAPRRHFSAVATTGDVGHLQAAAWTACLRCNGGHQLLCGCRAADHGRRCTEPAQCEGVCLFDRFEKIPEPICTARPRERCPVSIPAGFRVGHCSDLKTPMGCLNVLTDEDSAARPIPIPGGLINRCFDEAALVDPAAATGSSRRR